MAVLETLIFVLLITAIVLISNIRFENAIYTLILTIVLFTVLVIARVWGGFRSRKALKTLQERLAQIESNPYPDGKPRQQG